MERGYVASIHFPRIWPNYFIYEWCKILLINTKNIPIPLLMRQGNNVFMGHFATKTFSGLRFCEVKHKVKLNPDTYKINWTFVIIENKINPTNRNKNRFSKIKIFIFEIKIGNLHDAKPTPINDDPYFSIPFQQTFNSRILKNMYLFSFWPFGFWLPSCMNSNFT